MAAVEQWWIVNNPTPGGGRAPVSETNYVVVESASTPDRVVSGPYATKADAEAVLKTDVASGANPVSGIAANVNIPNPFSWVGAIAHWVGDAVGHLTDAAMWKSIGWLLLGIAMMVGGVMLWVKGDLPDVMPIPM